MSATTDMQIAEAPPPIPRDARIELGRFMLEQQVPAAIRHQLSGSASYGLILVAPSEKHVGIVADALEALFGESLSVHCLDRPSSANASSLIQDLASGSVVAICSGLDQVPATFKALADDVVQLYPHDAAALRATMKVVLNGTVPRFNRNFVVHPDPELLCRCISPGLLPARVVAALAKLGNLTRLPPSERVPDLDAAVEFGEARSWGLRVRSEMAAWRAGQFKPEDLDCSVLLVSPPGHGKTLFARVMSKGLNVPLFVLKLGDLFVREGHLGHVIGELREQFSTAASAAPAVLLLDELDSFGRRDQPEASSSFKNGLINEILTLLDGAENRAPGLVVIGATNAPNAIDPALRRHGRLGRTIELALPTAEGVENILRYHLGDDLKQFPIQEIVALAGGMTPAELMNLVRTSRQVARAEGRPLKTSDILEQFETPEPIDWPKLQRIALHEAGHALACIFIPKAPVLHSVSVLESKETMGKALTRALPGATTRSTVEGHVKMVLAGRAAEAITYGDEDPSNGAAVDLAIARSLLCRLHGAWGMGHSLLVHEEPEALLGTDPRFADRIEMELDRLMAEVRAELVGREVHLRAVALHLCQHKTLSGLEVLHIIEAIECGLDALEAEQHGQEPGRSA